MNVNRTVTVRESLCSLNVNFFQCHSIHSYVFVNSQLTMVYICPIPNPNSTYNVMIMFPYKSIYWLLSDPSLK